ncbi:MAG: TIGR02281 family clan AA aspartic protease [Burkholderiales bacterium]|nr:TIGR02281 family clan AA aspartic protease [Burkholderiales bacterium]
MLGILLAPGATAADVRVVGLFGAKAVVSVDGGAPRTVRAGERLAEHVRLLAVERDGAVFEIDGQRRTLRIGQPYVSRAPAAAASVTLTADASGHFVAEGTVNGAAMRFLVDTGATLIALPAADARRAGVAYANAPQGVVSTAGGAAVAYKVKLDTVSVGGISLSNVDAVVLEKGLTIPLLGGSFLSRMAIETLGRTMVLRKRF